LDLLDQQTHVSFARNGGRRLFGRHDSHYFDTGDKVKTMWMRCVLLMGISLMGLAETVSGPWRADQVVQTADLAKKFPGAKPAVIFMVGPRVLYNGNHVQGAIFAGPAGTEAGLALLKERVSHVAKDAEIVIYCGCCPMERCPNIRPAFAALRDAGFQNVKIVEIPTNLKTDWTDKGYPVEKGEIEK
jgi:rhodanese-related sulfurtransferase